MTRLLHCVFACCIFFTLAACSDSNNGAAVSIAPDTQPIPEPEPSLFLQTTVDLVSSAEPRFTPGSPGVEVSNEKLLTQFGQGFSLNHARYTRYYLSDYAADQADGILVLVPGFEGGAAEFAILAENLLRKAQADTSLILEVWAIDRRSNQLEDTAGLNIAERELDPYIALDYLFGAELGLPLGDTLQTELGRRAVFYNTTDDVAFMAQWTTLVHTLDIDAVVEAARAAALNGNVFLGGHSAGTGYAARYAATDFNFQGGTPAPGYQKLRGLVMSDGGGGSIRSEALNEATLDSIEAAFDGGLYGAVSSGAARCIDGLTACATETALSDCAAFQNRSCTPARPAYSEVAGLLTSQVFAAAEAGAIDAAVNGDSHISILQEDQGGIEGNNAIEQVPALSGLKLLLGTEPATSVTLIGLFLDDDGVVASLASFISTSVGAPGPTVEGIRTWLNNDEVLPVEALPDNGPAPTELSDAGIWGQEVEPTDLENRLIKTFYQGQTNFSDWYYPSSGLSIGASLGLDTSALSAPPPLGRGRSDIANRTQAQKVDIPVIAFGASNGLLPVPGYMLPYADSLAVCSAPSCDGLSARVLDRNQPNTAFPTFGDISGGFEAYISEGYSHVDITTASDDGSSEMTAQLLAFIQRNLQ